MKIIFDLDGTLSDDRHRSELAQNGLWDEYHGAGAQDPVHLDAQIVIQQLGRIQNVELIILTGRTEKFRTPTSNWLMENSIPCNALLMRGDFDFRKATIMKRDMLLEHIGITDERKLHEHILLMLDNDDRSVAFFRDLGLNCWSVR